MAPAAEWTNEEIELVGSSTELELASRRTDGSLRPFTTMWVAGVGDELYVRSAGGSDRPWYQRALASGEGRIRASGIERDVTFGDANPEVHAPLDVAYHQKYDRYGPDPVGRVTGPPAELVTIRLVPTTGASHGDQ
jgi:hypothetical protein